MAAGWDKLRRRGRMGWVAVAGALLVVLLVVMRWRGAPLKEPPANGYVDSAECVGCHQEEAAGYRKTGMGRSFYRMTAAQAVEDFARANQVVHQASGMQYRMLERNGEFFERRSQVGFDGAETNVKEERIDFAVGSGNHARTFLHRAADGQLIELPVSWYTERGGYWAMSPGYDWKGQSDFGRAISAECMFCHNGYPQGDVGLERSIFPENLPEGIDCQRCHGPGRAHVEAARSGHATREAVSAAIVNPAHLGRERQMEVCMQCHLEPSRHEPHEQRLFDRGVFSYKAGEPLGDYALYFDKAGGQADGFEIAHAAYRLRESACFRGSQMTCLTCHDPHDIPRGPEAVAEYTAVCQSCHQKVVHTVALPGGSNCISCHMPKRRTDDVVHVVMTDHFIRKTQPKRDLLAPIAETDGTSGPLTNVALYYPERKPGTPAAEIAIAETQLNDGVAGPDGGAGRLAALLDRTRPAAPEPYVALALAYERMGNDAEVVRWSEQALARRKAYRPALVEMVPALFRTGQGAHATQLLEEAAAVYPADDLLLSDLGSAYFHQGQTARAAEMLARALKANPDRAETHIVLGEMAAERHEMDTAEREFREALRCDPASAEANDRLGGLLFDARRYPEAAFHFEAAIRVNDEDAEGHHRLGRTLVLMDRLPQGVAELRTAARLDAKNVAVHEDLADVLAATGRAAEATAEYERVLVLNPDMPAAQLGLGMALLGQRRAAEARLHLEAAARGADPEVAQTAARVLAQISH